MLASLLFSVLTPSKAQDLVLPGGRGGGTNITYTTNNYTLGSNTVAAGANVTVTTNVTGSNIVYTVASEVSSASVTNTIQSFLGSSTNASGQAFTNLLWGRTLFVDSEYGNDTTARKGDVSKPWLNAHIALLAAIPGDIVYLREGVHNIGTNVFNVGHGVKVTGAGDGSWLRGSGGLLTNGPIVGLTGSTCEVSHITIENSGRDFYQSAVIGFFQQATNAQRGGTNMVIHDLNLIGDSDSVYLRSTNSWTLRGNDIRSYSKWDNWVQFSESSNGVSRWTSCYFESDLKGALNPQSVSVGECVAIKVQGGVAEFLNCSAIGTNGNSSTRGVAVSGRSIVRWSGGLIKAAGTNDVKPVDNAANTGTFFYIGNQLGIEDMTGFAPVGGGGIVFGSEQVTVSNIAYKAGGVVINDIDRLSDPVFISSQGGVNIGALTDPGAARLQVGSLPGSGDYVAKDGNGLLFSTNAPAGGSGSLVTNANQFGANPTLNIKNGALVTNLNFNADGFPFMIGTDANQFFGISNRTTGRWSFWNGDGSGDTWSMAGSLFASNVNLATPLGSGNLLGISSAGTVFRTNNTAFSNALATALGGAPGGTNGAIQFNQEGAFAGTNELLYRRSDNVLIVTNKATAVAVNIGTTFIYGQGDSDFYLGVGNTPKWRMENGTGNWLPQSSNLVDVGSFQYPVKTNYTGALQISPNKGAGKVLTSDGDGVGTWQAASGTSLATISNGFIRLQIQSCILPTNNMPGLDTGSNYVWRLLFDDTTDETAYWAFTLPDDYGTNATIVCTYSTLAAAANKTNCFQFSTQILKPLVSNNINVDSYADSGGVTNIIPTTAGWATNFSGNLSISAVAGDFVRLKVNRDADNATDSATGDTALHAISIRYTKR